MRMISRKERQFLEKWKTTRINKWRYVFLQGGLYWGLPGGLLSYLVTVGVGAAQFRFTDFLVHSILFVILGMGWGYLWYRVQEKRFQQVFLSDKAA
jgi:hypothetical protein